MPKLPVCRRCRRERHKRYFSYHSYKTGKAAISLYCVDCRGPGTGERKFTTRRYPKDTASEISGISFLQYKIALLMMEGKSDVQIADYLGIHFMTYVSLKRAAYEMLEVHDRTAFAVKVWSATEGRSKK